MPGSFWHSSSTARSKRSASPRERLTCLFRTLSMVLLHSRCLSRICLKRTWLGSSFLARLWAGPSSILSKKTTIDPRPRSPTCPSHCTAASTRAPAAILARGAQRFDTVDTAVLLPMQLYRARHTNARPKCGDSKCKTFVSGVDDSCGEPFCFLKSASPSDLVHCIAGASPCGAASRGSSSSSSSSSTSTACSVVERALGGGAFGGSPRAARRDRSTAVRRMA
mmetsp:Transcript_40225/g.83913  ORF Transcript_40225/g.83913 Transcript_40225/m.83913 type:complete len:223 (-) Transcript_40225:133-801(-)